MKLKIQARAKINWTLDVVGTLPNGYHDLDMLMQSVTLCDQMTMEEAPQLTLYVLSLIHISTGGAYTAIRERMKALFVIYMSNL